MGTANSIWPFIFLGIAVWLVRRAWEWIGEAERRSIELQDEGETLADLHDAAARAEMN